MNILLIIPKVLAISHKESLTKYAGLKSAIKHGNVISKIDSNHKKVVKENRDVYWKLFYTVLTKVSQFEDIEKMKILKTWAIF